ncbi:hypothetical protein [Paraburkholderia fynbosensis]|uniref:Uncharacterized protein n=1 Tax=Paraburkholderia fynbosensis TaxID=1200993 RepID=A0A6J5FL78_9BURK|nr:hypothetical protein [Paraburkholderia fynbosensis]CAB3780759.1 hypothetical protein LMG27177_00994 [Paraburkholderia fynbosensis]
MTHIYDIGCDYDLEYDMVSDAERARRRRIFESFMREIVSYMEDEIPDDLTRCIPAMKLLMEMKEGREPPQEIAIQLDMILGGQRFVGKL